MSLDISFEKAKLLCADIQGRITQRHYDVQFARASGVTAESFEPMSAANQNEYVRLLPATQLATDLEPVFREFFGNLSGDNDPEMLTECFVETRESRYADASLEKIVRSVSSSIASLDPTINNQLVREIKEAVESGRGETVIIVGNPGSGKSTFMERFFKSVLETSVRERCSVVKVDVSKATNDLTGLSRWLTKHVKDGLETLIFKDGLASYEELQGLYFREYQSWMRGEFKPLYESDKNAFKIKFGEFLSEQKNSDPYTYLLRILEHIVRSRKMLPCLIFDNADSFDFAFQEAVFQYSQAIRETVPFSFIVVPVTDRSFWKLSKAGPFQKFPSKMFYLPVPPTKSVLEKRVEFLKRKIENQKDERSYFLKKGIRLTIENIQGFAACLEEVFVMEDFVSRRLSWLANNNLKKCLNLAQSVILSPVFSVDDLVKSFVIYGKNVPLKIDYRKFMQALLHGHYNAFQQDQNIYVLNVFSVSQNFATSPLLLLSILKMLIERSAVEEGDLEGYVSIEQVTHYFVAAGVTEGAIDNAISTLLSSGLIQPYDSSQDDVDATDRIAISHCGRIHFEMPTTDSFFVTEMAFATPLRSTKLVDTLRSARLGNMSAEEIQKQFFEYLIDQDKLFVRLPTDAMFDNQRQFRSEMVARWIEQSSTLQPVAADGETENFSHREAIVSWYDPERGYGFAEAGLGRSLFVHRTTLEQAGIDLIEKGDKIVCDVAPVPKGKLEAIAIHSVQKLASVPLPRDALVVDGVMEFWNAEKGYGFLRAENLPDDAYLSARSVGADFAGKLRGGARVKATVARQRFGKFAVAVVHSVT